VSTTKAQRELSYIVQDKANSILNCRPEAARFELVEGIQQVAVGCGVVRGDGWLTLASVLLATAWHALLLAAKSALSPRAAVSAWDRKLAELSATFQRRAEAVVDEVPTAASAEIAAVLGQLAAQAACARSEDEWASVGGQLLACGRWCVELARLGEAAC